MQTVVVDQAGTGSSESEAAREAAALSEPLCWLNPFPVLSRQGGSRRLSCCGRDDPETASMGERDISSRSMAGEGNGHPRSGHQRLARAKATSDLFVVELSAKLAHRGGDGQGGNHQSGKADQLGSSGRAAPDGVAAAQLSRAGRPRQSGPGPLRGHHTPARLPSSSRSSKSTRRSARRQISSIFSAVNSATLNSGNSSSPVPPRSRSSKA
jgi:hypothetical protein